jgi:hypothetical protein
MLLTNWRARQTLIALMICLTIFAAEAFPMQQAEEERSHRELRRSFLDN